ncbi:hypothetical protein [Natronomonas sp. EA1]|uniref:hypothetical protein n=1 Tax=Natronomonas sp. EA1 TaxID=3421655 RepID=UPI003EC05D70
MREQNANATDQPYSQRLRRRPTRRSVLQALGATAVIGTTVPGLASGISSENIIYLRGSYDSPVPFERIREARQKAAQRGNSQKVKGSANPAFPENGRIVDYIVTPRGNGIPRQFIGVAGNPQSVDDVHARAQEKAQAFKNGGQDQGGSSSDGSDGLVSISQTGSGWNNVTPTDDEGYYSEYPYGAVQNNFDWWKLTNSQEEYGRDTHAIHQYHAMIPGKSKWGGSESEWQNEYAKAYHWWNRGEQTNPELRKWDPYTQDGSSYNISIGTSTEPLSWSFPVNNTDLHTNTDFTVPRAEWKWQIWGNQYRESTMGFEPGSTCEVDEHSCGQYDLLEFRSYGGFQNELDLSRHGLYYDWTLWWDFGTC